MKIRTLLMSSIVCLTTTVTAMAEFTPPTEAQITAAASDPAKLQVLLNGASLEQAAHVVKTVIARIAALTLAPQALESRISQVMGTTVATLPPSSSLLSFATMLGTEMGISLAIQNNPAVVSLTQGALTSNAGAGTSGESVAKAFGDAYEQAASGSANPQNTKDANKAQPPDATLYTGQT